MMSKYEICNISVQLIHWLDNKINTKLSPSQHLAFQNLKYNVHFIAIQLLCTHSKIGFNIFLRNFIYQK